MNDPYLSQYRYAIPRRILSIGLLVFILLILAGFQSQTQNIAVNGPEASDNSTLVVDWPVEDYTIMNGTVYWTYLAGDIGNYSRFLMSQQINDPSTLAPIVEVQGTNPIYYTELVADPAQIYYKNSTNKRIESRNFLNINSYNTLFSYADSNEPTGLALADGFVYWSSKDKTIRRIPIGGGITEKVADTNGTPKDISIDDENIWFGTETGVYWVKRNCSLPCSPNLVYTTNVKQLFAAGRTDPTYRQAVFWVAINKSSPESVESWDCRVPGSKACMHKVLYQGTTNFSVYGLAASPENVFWVETDNGNPPSSFLRRAPRNCPTPCAPTSIDKLVDPVLPKGSWEPSHMMMDDVDIYFKHKGLSKIEQDADPIVWELAYDAMEVTQVTQSLLNDVPLVAAKPTFVRLYGHLISGEDLVFPEAQLIGTHNNTPLPGSPLQPIHKPKKLTAGVPYDRDNMDNYWLFEIPPSWTVKENVQLTGKIDPRRLYDATPPTSPTKVVSFLYRPPICVIALKVSQHAPTARATDPGFQLAVRTAELLLPTPEIRIFTQGSKLEEGIWPFYSPYEMQDDGWKLLMNIWWRDRFSDDPDECDSANARTLYTGMIHSQARTDNVNGTAYVHFDPSWTKLPWATSTWSHLAGWPLNGREATMAHEFGHNFGRWHVDCPVGDPEDTDPYPYDSCHLSPIEGDKIYYGFDLINKEAIHPEEGSDLMSYESPRWISDHTWKKIYYNNPFVFPLNLAPQGNADLIVNGVFDPANPQNSEVGFAWVMPAGTLSDGLQAKWNEDAARIRNTNSINGTRIHLRLIGLGNIVLADHDVELVDIGEGTGQQVFQLTTAAPSSLVVKIELMEDNTVLATRRPGLLVPQVAITKPTWGAVSNGELTVGWTANDPNGDTLKFIVQISHDLGVHWQTLGSEIQGSPGITEYETVFDTSTIPGSGGIDALVRVIASDGYNTSVATSEKFLTALRQPEAYIGAPANGADFLPGETIRLDGSATDPEDGTLTGSALTWKLNNASIGSGDPVYLPGLKPGNYNVQLTASDLDQMKGTANTAFSIAPLQIAEGKARLDGKCIDPDYAETPQIQLAPYADGTQATVYAVRNDKYIWFCFSGLKTGGNYANSFAGVRLDTDFSQHTLAQTNDYGFFVRPNGGQFTRQGNGSGGFGSPTYSFVNNSLASKVEEHADGKTWSAELRIEYYYTSLRDRFAIDFGHYWVGAQGDDYHWPYAAKYNQPHTWAESYRDTAPLILSAAPENSTLPISELVIVLNGSNFRNDDRVLWNGAVLRTTYVNSSLIYGLVQGSGLTAGTHKVEVIRDGDTGVISNRVFVTVSNPVPTLTSLSPDFVAQGEGGKVISIFGTNFMPGARVYWNGQEIVPDIINSTHLKINVSSTEFSLHGFRTIVVANPAPTESVSEPLFLTIAPPWTFLPAIRH